MNAHCGCILAVLFSTALLASAADQACADPQSAPLSHIDPGEKAPDFAAAGADGRVHHLSDYAGKIVVLEWTNPVCPYTGMKYQEGAMQALQKRASTEGVVWIAIDTAAPDRPGFLTASAMRTRIARLHMHVAAFLSDADGHIGREYGAKTTPEIYVINRDGKLAYEGAVDDNPAAEQPGGPSYVGAAIAELRAGTPVSIPQSLPYGCAVEY